MPAAKRKQYQMLVINQSYHIYINIHISIYIYSLLHKPFQSTYKFLNYCCHHMYTVFYFLYIMLYQKNFFFCNIIFIITVFKGWMLLYWMDIVLLVILILLQHLGCSYFFRINNVAMNHYKSFTKKTLIRNGMIKSTENPCSK